MLVAIFMMLNIFMMLMADLHVGCCIATTTV
jgi:hypothetical protein